MAESNEFAEFIQRIRAGDPAAATELVRRFEPLIRREIRLRLSDKRLHRGFDSEDVCQSVMASFFLRTAAGQYDLDRPEQLAGLLVQMARNKLASNARAQNAARRDHRRVEAGSAAMAGVAAQAPTPSQVVMGRELLDRFHALLTAEERQITDLRTAGTGWDEIAEQLGGTAEGRRMQHARAVKRAATALGVDESEQDE